MKRIWKNVAMVVVVAAISSGAAIGTSSYLMQQKNAEVVSTGEFENTFKQPVRTVAYSAVAAENTDFTIAAESAVHGVVHIKATTNARSSSGGESYFDPFEYFFGFGGRGNFQRPTPQPKVGSGSGVIISTDGYIITNNHVVEGASKIYVTLHNSKQYEATLVGTDPETDIAVIKIKASGLVPATYGNSDELEVGDMSVIIGNPLGELGGTVTAGIVSALDREITIDGQPMTLLQTDASVNPGNSGGGMFDQYGHLIGIVVAKSSGSDVEGLGFAIPINTAAEVASQLMKNGKVESTTGYSGMTYAQSQNGDIFIQQVNESFAQEAGFKPGDQVISIDGQTVSSLNEVSTIIKKHKKGDKVTYTVARDGKQMDIDLTLQSIS